MLLGKIETAYRRLGLRLDHTQALIIFGTFTWYPDFANCENKPLYFH